MTCSSSAAELGQHLIDTTAHDSRDHGFGHAFGGGPAHIRWMKNDSEAIRLNIFWQPNGCTVWLKYPANGLRERKGSAYV
jgi:hypothetical protein